MRDWEGFPAGNVARMSAATCGAATSRSSRMSLRSSATLAAQTNAIEGLWSIIKRGVVDTFQKKYLPLYVAELQFRYHNRFSSDIFGTAISGC
jgi:hypothetical protein